MKDKKSERFINLYFLLEHEMQLLPNLEHIFFMGLDKLSENYKKNYKDGHGHQFCWSEIFQLLETLMSAVQVYKRLLLYITKDCMMLSSIEHKFQKQQEIPTECSEPSIFLSTFRKPVGSDDTQPQQDPLEIQAQHSGSDFDQQSSCSSLRESIRERTDAHRIPKFDHLYASLQANLMHTNEVSAELPYLEAATANLQHINAGAAANASAELAHNAADATLQANLIRPCWSDLDLDQQVLRERIRKWTNGHGIPTQADVSLLASLNFANAGAKLPYIAGFPISEANLTNGYTSTDASSELSLLAADDAFQSNLMRSRWSDSDFDQQALRERIREWDRYKDGKYAHGIPNPFDAAVDVSAALADTAAHKALQTTSSHSNVNAAVDPAAEDALLHANLMSSNADATVDVLAKLTHLPKDAAVQHQNYENFRENLFLNIISNDTTIADYKKKLMQLNEQQEEDAPNYDDFRKKFFLNIISNDTTTTDYKKKLVQTKEQQERYAHHVELEDENPEKEAAGENTEKQAIKVKAAKKTLAQEWALAAEAASAEKASEEEASEEEASTEEASAEKESAEQTSTEEASVEKASAEEASEYEASAYEESAEEASVGEASAYEASAEEASAEEASAEEASAEDASAEEASAYEASAEKAPAEKESAVEASVGEALAEKASAEEAPAEKESAVEASVGEALAEKASAEEESAEESEKKTSSLLLRGQQRALAHRIKQDNELMMYNYDTIRKWIDNIKVEKFDTTNMGLNERIELAKEQEIFYALEEHNTPTLDMPIKSIQRTSENTTADLNIDMPESIILKPYEEHDEVAVGSYIMRKGAVLHIIPRYFKSLNEFYASILDNENEEELCSWSDAETGRLKYWTKCPARNSIVLAKYSDGAWYRAKVESVAANAKNQVKLFFIDCGYELMADFRRLLVCDANTASWPAQVIHFRVYKMLDIAKNDAQRQEGLSLLNDALLSQEVLIILRKLSDMEISFLDNTHNALFKKLQDMQMVSIDE